MNVIITPTRDRYEQLCLVKKCIENQTVLPDLWIIADDSREELPCSFFDGKVKIKYIHERQRLKSSTCMNSANSLSIKADRYVFFDDDDYYPPQYFEYFLSLLNREDEMVGNMRWIDYRLSTCHYRIRIKSDEQLQLGDALSEWHGSGISGEKLREDMIKILSSHPSERYNDCLCYRFLFHGKRYNCRMVDFGENSCISLKDYGVGNAGIISAHRSNDGMICDKNLTFFKEHLKDGWKNYEKYLGRIK